MIREAIRIQAASAGITYRSVSKSTGIPYDAIKSYVLGNRDMLYNDIVTLLMGMKLSFGYKEVGVAIRKADTFKQDLLDKLSARGIKRKEFALYCNINVCTFSSWLNGKRHIQTEHLEHILTALGMGVFPLA